MCNYIYQKPDFCVNVIQTVFLFYRCVHITDIGIGYISTMLALNTLFLRWCTQIRDFGLQHICGMRSMQILSLAGNCWLIKLWFDGLYKKCQRVTNYTNILHLTYYRLSTADVQWFIKLDTITASSRTWTDQLSRSLTRTHRISKVKPSKVSRTRLDLSFEKEDVYFHR